VSPEPGPSGARLSVLVSGRPLVVWCDPAGEALAALVRGRGDGDVLRGLLLPDARLLVWTRASASHADVRAVLGVEGVRLRFGEGGRIAIGLDALVGGNGDETDHEAVRARIEAAIRGHPALRTALGEDFPANWYA